MDGQRYRVCGFVRAIPDVRTFGFPVFEGERDRVLLQVIDNATIVGWTMHARDASIIAADPGIVAEVGSRAIFCFEADGDAVLFGDASAIADALLRDPLLIERIRQVNPATAEAVSSFTSSYASNLAPDATPPTRAVRFAYGASNGREELHRSDALSFPVAVVKARVEAPTASHVLDPNHLSEERAVELVRGDGISPQPLRKHRRSWRHGLPYEPELRRVRWLQACRIVPVRYPSVTLFDRVADAADFDALYALEVMSNKSVRDELLEIERIPREDRIFGPGSGPIMAAFSRVDASVASRFSAGAYGVFYATRDRATAIAETRHAYERFRASTSEPREVMSMRLYHLSIDARLHDLRPASFLDSAVYDPNDYTESQKLGEELRSRGATGIVYRSTVEPGGQQVALFKPTGASGCFHARYMTFKWSGERWEVSWI